MKAKATKPLKILNTRRRYVKYCIVTVVFEQKMILELILILQILTILLFLIEGVN
jgi:hypothetical protein